MRARWLPALWLLPLAAFGAETAREQPVQAGERLELRNYAGSVTVVRGDASTLRVTVKHADEDSVTIERVGSTWLVVPSLWKRDSGEFAVQLPHMGRVVVRDDDRPPRPASFRVEVPAWMPVVVESPRANIEIDGGDAAVEVTAMLGDISVTGGRDRVHLRTMNGRIVLSGASGRITAETTIHKITLRDCRGDIRVEATQGGIELVDLEVDSMKAQTLEGDLHFAGAVRPGASWDLVSQAGDIELRLREPVDARFDLRAFQGRVDFGFPTDSTVAEDRVQATVGRGQARILAQTFRGRVVVAPE